MTEALVFIGGSAVIVYVSREGLRNRHSYGYYRFFGFEFVLLEIVSVLHAWFLDPLSPAQIASWTLLVASALVAWLGFNGLKSRGDPKESFESTTRLVDTGIYKLIRHPMYASLVLLAGGAFLKSPSMFGAILLFGASFSFASTAKAEEVLNLEKFGEAYLEYTRRSRMFIPYLY